MNSRHITGLMDPTMACAGLTLAWSPALAQARGEVVPQPATVAAASAASLEIVFPPPGGTVSAGRDGLRSVGVVVRSNFRLMPAGQCGSDSRCGHVHLKVDPDGDSCNLPGRPYNSMNSDFGGNLISAHFGPCPQWQGAHVIGVLLADDHHRPVLVDGKPVTATVRVDVR